MIRLLAYRSSNVIDLMGMWLMGFCAASGHPLIAVAILAIGLPTSIIVELIDRRRRAP